MTPGQAREREGDRLEAVIAALEALVAEIRGWCGCEERKLALAPPHWPKCRSCGLPVPLRERGVMP